MNTNAASPVRYRLRSHLNTLVIALLLVAGLAIGGYGYQQAREMALASAEASFQQLGKEAASEMEVLFGPVETMLGVLAGGQLPAQRTLEDRLRFVPALAGALQRNPRMSAVYVGYADGAFFLVRSLAGDTGSELGAPPGASYLVQHTGGRSSSVYIWMDEKLREIEREPRPEYRFEPRERPWYKEALTSGSVVRGAPYVFFTTLRIGKTFSLRANDGKAVFGADFRLTELSSLLADRTRSLDASAQAVIFDDSGTVIAHRDPERAIVAGDVARRAVTIKELESPVLTEATRRATAGELDRLVGWKDADREWRILLARLPESGRHKEFLAAAIPVKALLAPADRSLAVTLLVIGAILLAALPLAWLVSHSVAQPLERLAKEATAMRRFDFTEPAQPVRSRIIEVDDLASSLTATRGAIGRFREISSAVAAEHDFQKLVARVLDESLALASGAAGVLRLVTSDGARLTTAMVRGPRVQASELPDVDFDADLPAARALKQQRVTVETIEAGQMPSTLAAAARGQDVTFVSVPLLDRRGQPLGVLSIARTGAGHRMDPRDDLVAFLAAIAGTLAVAIENQKLLKEQKDLLEGMIQLTAGAIDAKSPYTGGHCQRVPVLTKMLVQAACDAKDGPFASYSLNEEEWEAVHIGAWLHDCGKVTTPEYVVDKATKLETIFDRLHEIRTRFEVLKRDADIAYWKGVAEGGDKAALALKRHAEQSALDADYAFVAQCNEGGEFMAPERIARLKAIGARSWTRTFDDVIGVSNDEKKRKQAVGVRPPPATEKLLDDKPEHIVPWLPSERVSGDNKWGFKVRVPEHKWNRGEVYNLSIGRGTLTDEERFVINDHMAQTIKMLTALPFPRHLRNVPEIAGGHHEKMDGTGYPKRLKRGEMSLETRMMAIADIFEALTAGDRPYKKAKTLSESIKIMGFMKKDRHVDPDLFDLFLKSGVYLRYAERFCAPEQIDKVDIAPYLTPAG